MSQAAQIRPDVLSENANKLVCDTLRRNIHAVLSGPLFHRYERVKAKLNLVHEYDAGRLQRYYAAVQKERNKRETKAGLAARYAPTAFDDDDEAFRQQDMDECDRDAA